MTDNDERIALLEIEGPAPVATVRQAIAPVRTPAPQNARQAIPTATPVAVVPAAQNATTGTAAPVSRMTGQPMRSASDASAPEVVRAIDAAVQTSREQTRSAARSPAMVRQAIPATRTGGAGRAPEGELQAGNLIAGAAASGNGALMGWTGSGRMTRGAIVSALATAGMPTEWAPTSKSAHAYAGQAVKLLDGSGYVTRAERSRGQQATTSTRSYRARWIVGEVGVVVADATSRAFGQRVLTVTLGAGDALTFEGRDALAQTVRESYEAQRAAESYEAGEVTAWLRNILIARFRAVRLGGVWYVPAKFVADAEKLCTSVSKLWGQDWIVPALPIATSQQMLTGIRNGIVEEVAAIERELREARDERQKKGEPEITSRLAARLLVDVGTVAERLRHYSVLLGETHTAPVRARLESLRGSLEPLADGLAQRFEQIGEEMGWKEGL